MEKIYLVDLQTNEIIDGGYLIYSVGSKIIYFSDSIEMNEKEIKFIKMVKEQINTLNEHNIVRQKDKIIETLIRILMVNFGNRKEANKTFEKLKSQIKVVNRNDVLKIKVFMEKELKRFKEVKQMIEELKNLE